MVSHGGVILALWGVIDPRSARAPRPGEVPNWSSYVFERDADGWRATVALADESAPDHVEDVLEHRRRAVGRQVAEGSVHVEVSEPVHHCPARHVGSVAALRRDGADRAQLVEHAVEEAVRPGEGVRVGIAGDALRRGERDREQARFAGRVVDVRPTGLVQAPGARRSGSFSVTASGRASAWPARGRRSPGPRPRRGGRRGPRSGGTPRCETPARRATSRSTTPSGPVVRASSTAVSTSTGRRLPWWYGCVRAVTGRG